VRHLKPLYPVDRVRCQSHERSLVIPYILRSVVLVTPSGSTP
jgi:hypothetical protein